MRSISALILGFCIFSCNSTNSIKTEKEFAKVYFDSLSKRYPDVKFQLNPDLTITAKKGDLDYIHYIDNVYAAYRSDPDSIRNVISLYVTSTTDIYNDKDTLDPGNIVPVIKPLGYLDEINSLNKDGKGVPMLTEKYNDQLIIAYAENSKNSIKYLTEDDLKSLTIPRDSLKPVALRNLGKIIPDIQRQGDNGMYMLMAGGDFEACLVLLSSLWTQENFPVDGNFVVAIPNRDLLFVTGTNNKDGISKIKAMTADAYKTGSYPISEYLYKWTGKKFERYE